MAIPKKIQVAVADDHVLLRRALSKLIASFEGYTVLFEADNGKEVKIRLGQHVIPDVLLLDVNMPEVDGLKRRNGYTNAFHMLGPGPFHV
jgi:chemotaxis response regulator CheB